MVFTTVFDIDKQQKNIEILNEELMCSDIKICQQQIQLYIACQYYNLWLTKILKILDKRNISTKHCMTEKPCKNAWVLVIISTESCQSSVGM